MHSRCRSYRFCIARSRPLEEHPDLEREVPVIRDHLASVDDMIRGK